MVKALIFDCFGVLVTEAWLPFKKQYFHDDPKLFAAASDTAKKANLGLISHSEFINTAARLAGISSDEAWAYISRNVADEDLFEYMKELKKTYQIGFLSNIADDYLHKMFSDEQLSLFDVIELSYRTGFVKPEAQAYELVAQRMKVDIGEALLVDDQQRNIDGAHRAGMQAILYKNLDQFKTDLAKLTAS
jgi:FMN phosphatase YigB (HAD superfamily)